MIVTFSQRAERELDELFDEYRVRASERTAMNMIDKIEARAMSLAVFPERGARFLEVSRDDLRFVVAAPFLIIYQTLPASVLVVAILHGSRDIRAEVSAMPRDA